MGVGALYVVVALMAVLMYVSARSTDTDISDMEPNNFDSFSVTKAQEGTVVPYVVGENRLTGNFLWYGNLVTHKVSENVNVGGKGGGGGKEKVTKGYNYYMDLWQGVCLGPGVVLEAMYVNDEYQFASGSFNGGGGSNYPIIPELTEVSKLGGVAHNWMEKFFLGFNVSQVPTIHYVVNRKLTSFPYSQYTNVGNGQNPAAIIYDILISGGAKSSDLLLTTFYNSAQYWYNKGYGLSLNFSKQQKIKEMIRKVLSYVDGAFYIDSNDQFNLVPFMETDTYAAEVTTEEFMEFSFVRRSWDDVASDYSGNYIDRDQHYTTRSLRVRNIAVARLTNNVAPISVDLTGFTDKTSASRRLFEIMKKGSYPEASVVCKLPMKYFQYNAGQILRITHSGHDIEGMDFRIISKDISGIEDNWVSFMLTEMIDDLFDDHYDLGGNISWVTPSYAPAEVVHQRVMELPYNNIVNNFFGNVPAHLVLMQRAGSETGAAIAQSGNGSDFSIKADVTTWSQHGTLVEAYIKETFTIDDDIGILFTPSYREDPVFETIARNSLFNWPRVAIIDDEIMAFQTVSYEGNNIRLTGVIRGILNTPVVTHSSGAEIWLTEISDNVLGGILTNSTSYIRILPYIGNNRLGLGDATSTMTYNTNYSSKPFPVASIEIKREDATYLTLRAWGISKTGGAGMEGLVLQTDSELSEIQLQWAFTSNPTFFYSNYNEYLTGINPFYITDTDRGTNDNLYVRTVITNPGNYVISASTYYGDWVFIASGLNSMAIGDVIYGPDF